MTDMEVTPGADKGVAQASAESQGPSQHGGSILNWLLVRERLARARAEASSQLTALQRESLGRAKVALELAQLALTPGNAVRSGSTSAHAANLFRQCVYWALLAKLPDGTQPAPAQIWAASDPTIQATLAVEESERARLKAQMGWTFVDFETESPEPQRATVDLFRRAAKRALAASEAPLRRLEWLQFVRLARVGGVLLVLAALLGVGSAVALHKTDLAQGKPWHVSSVGIECHPNKSECGGVTTDILFHTRQESNPWFEYDFGAPLTFSSLAVQNRSDYGPEKALPLVVEVSDDNDHFREIARRTEPFWIWKPSFPPQQARYLRLRVARESILHLEAVHVYR